MDNLEDQTDVCPNYGVHKYFINGGKTYTEFTPFTGTALYERKEYAVMACNCGDAYRTEIKDRG